MPTCEHELDALRQQKSQTLEESHFNKKRGKLLDFQQGAKDKKSKNQALIEFEKCNHKTYAEAVLCIKVSKHIIQSFQKSIQDCTINEKFKDASLYDVC